MGVYLLNTVANDGSRLFASLPHTRLLVDLYDHLKRIPGLTVTGLVRDELMGAFIECDFCRYVFVIVEESREYRFYVNPRQCPDEILAEVTEYCDRFLLPRFFPSVALVFGTEHTQL